MESKLREAGFIPVVNKGFFHPGTGARAAILEKEGMVAVWRSRPRADGRANRKTVKPLQYVGAVTAGEGMTENLRELAGMAVSVITPTVKGSMLDRKSDRLRCGGPSGARARRKIRELPGSKKLLGWCPAKDGRLLPW
jgi:hypothetical protein